MNSPSHILTANVCFFAGCDMLAPVFHVITTFRLRAYLLWPMWKLYQVCSESRYRGQRDVYLIVKGTDLLLMVQPASLI
jgi:hypothetical protein